MWGVRVVWEGAVVTGTFEMAADVVRSLAAEVRSVGEGMAGARQLTAMAVEDAVEGPGEFAGFLSGEVLDAGEVWVSGCGHITDAVGLLAREMVAVADAALVTDAAAGRAAAGIGG